MAIDKNSNAFTFIFSVAMVAVVGAVLSFASMSLKPRQVENAIQKEMMSILSTIGVEATRDNVNEQFYTYVKERITLNHKGEAIATRTGKIDPKDAEDPFNVDIQKEYRNRTLAPESRNFPMYVAEVNGKRLAIIPMVGKGLWGPIWGYVALEDDYNTVFGAVFAHKSETPGLGAEITEGFFQNPFRGKKLYNNQGTLVSIQVKKGGADPSDMHAVDAITGGTITSNGVTEMLERTFGVYDLYFQKSRTQLSQMP
jgi:Na+-transporting NADH:ubiquinone oxidoreductase subunit C